ncbi:MAG: hypothetical protein LCH82_01485 [Actinobacteria bacterium]|nr:hypothetical protein [Actinomycetota bacterium]
MQLADVPGVTEGFSGTQGNAWLTTWAIAWLMDAEPGLVARLRESGVDLPTLPSRTEVTPELMTAATRWPPALDLLLRAGPAAPGYDAASAVARRLGSALGALVVTLVTGPARIRAQRPDWPSGRWSAWAAVQRIMLGGGTIRGELGHLLVSEAQEVVDLSGVGVTVHRAPEPESLVLRGVAATVGDGVAIDCGGTNLKASRVRHGRPVGGVQVIPSPGRVSADDVLDTIVRSLLPLLVPGAEIVPVALALATYVDETGQPYDNQLGVYAPLGHVEIQSAFAKAGARHTDRRLAPVFVHDGAAALAGARLTDPQADAAIVLGTAIGSGLTIPG